MRKKSLTYISLYAEGGDPSPLCPEGDKRVVWQTEERNRAWGFAVVFPVSFLDLASDSVFQIPPAVIEELRLRTAERF